MAVLGVDLALKLGAVFGSLLCSLPGGGGWVIGLALASAVASRRSAGGDGHEESRHEAQARARWPTISTKGPKSMKARKRPKAPELEHLSAIF